MPDEIRHPFDNVDEVVGGAQDFLDGHEVRAVMPGEQVVPLEPERPTETDCPLVGQQELAHLRMQNILREIAGLDAVALQPAAGAQGELTALLVAAAFFRDKGEKRTRVRVAVRL